MLFVLGIVHWLLPMDVGAKTRRRNITA